MAAAIDLAEIEAARHRVSVAAVRTPLVRFEGDEPPGAQIHLKLEVLQPIGSFKIRGATNAMSLMETSAPASGFLTASAGNMAQAVAWNARRLGLPCTVVAPDTAPPSKLAAVERLGGRVIRVPFDRWWQTFSERSFPGERGAFVHPFDDERVMAGNGTIGLELLEDLPDLDVVLVPWGGGGLSCGIASAIRAIRPATRVYAVEVDTAAPLAASLAAGRPVTVDMRPSFIDGIGSKTVIPGMFDRARELLAGSLTASADETAAALRLMVERNHVVPEGAGAVALAVALAGRAGDGKIACVVSGGSIGNRELAALLRS
jgi:threonine dehydratase